MGNVTGPSSRSHARSPSGWSPSGIALKITKPGNDAERTLRAIVVKRKIFGLTRSHRSDIFIDHGFSVIETCRRQGRDAFEYLQ